jgi:hypothetical protein
MVAHKAPKRRTRDAAIAIRETIRERILSALSGSGSHRSSVRRKQRRDKSPERANLHATTREAASGGERATFEQRSRCRDHLSREFGSRLALLFANKS